MLFSEATGRPVVSSTTAETIGRVAGFVVDPATRAICAVEVKKSRDGSVLPWTHIDAFGEDAVVVDSSVDVVEPDEAIEALLGKDHALIGKRVLTTAGEEVGEVEDVRFSPGSGMITTLVLSSGDVGGARLVGVGAYAVVVDTAPA